MIVDRTYDGLLPWGYRMRVKPGGDGIVVLDDDGREWTSIRHALFHGRLGFTSRWAVELDVQLERLLAYLLTATGLAGEVGTKRSRVDLFESRDAALFYDMWLIAQRLKDGDGHINEEARAIARMLLATRPLKLEPFHPGVESILYLQGRVEEIDRPAFERGDEDLARLRYAFVRERIGRSAAISLLHRDFNARMPLVRTIWMHAFADERSRDHYFEWMERRLERWNAWGDVAYRKGAPALTRHLFSMLVDEMEERPVAYGHEGAAKPLMAIEYRTP